MRYWICWLFMLTLPMVTASPSSGGLQVVHAWILDAPPTAHMRAGYVELRNSGVAEVEISGVDSEDFEQVELHETCIKEGIARMLPIRRAIIPAQGQLKFVPGGAHFMLIGPRRVLALGDSTRVRLHLTSGDTIDVQFIVEKS